MWNNNNGNQGADQNARLAASALAAYSTTPPGLAGYFAPPQPFPEMHPQQQQPQHQDPYYATHEQEPVPDASPQSVESQQEEAQQQEEVAIVPRGKPEAMAKALGEARLKREKEEQEAAAQKSPPRKKKKKKPAPKKKPVISGPTMEDPVDPITGEDYEALARLMEQFCKVPLLAEFSRPVALLHPELLTIYSKIVTRPIDMGKVCRSVRRRQYDDMRSVRLDMWRIFCNCIRYHTHPNNKNAVPSFCSISLHLRSYFNALWQEYCIPSDAGGREKDRTKRIKATSATYLSVKTIEKMAMAIREFLKDGGRVDGLDKVGVLEQEDEEGDLNVVVSNLRKYQERLLLVANSQADSQLQTNEDYTVLDMVTEYRKCYESPDLFQTHTPLKVKVKNRLERILGKIICPIYEANGRGVNQSSIWGCMAAAIWARESSKKPFWPALVLGILAPDDQREDWHAALTERNEERLPEKLLSELQAGKRKAEQALKRQNQGSAEQQSFFLVEFMGTHEFIWVKEADIIENFDPDYDPNTITNMNLTKKQRSRRSHGHDVTKSKTYADGIEEARWALEEFEMQLNDTCGDLAEVEDEDGEQGYSYSVLCQSDEEAEEYGADQETDLDEANELLATDGLLDLTPAGRKEAKKRAAARKKAKVESEKKQAQNKRQHAKKEKGKKKVGSKVQDAAQKKTREEKKEVRELERKRRKRSRERERFLKEEMRKQKRRRLPDIPDKRARANAIVKGYLSRLAQDQDLSALNVMLAVPASAVESSGLLGMALAFRAAAGEIDMPDPSLNNTKPYENIDTDSPLTSAERVARLEKKLALMEEEASTIREHISRRKLLTDQAIKEGKEIYEGIVQREAEAKKSEVKKRKKYPKKKGEKKEEQKDEGTNEDAEGEQEDKMQNDDASTDDVIITVVESTEVEDPHHEEEASRAESSHQERSHADESSHGDGSFLLADEGEEAIPKMVTHGEITEADQFEDADD